VDVGEGVFPVAGLGHLGCEEGGEAVSFLGGEGFLHCFVEGDVEAGVMEREDEPGGEVHCGVLPVDVGFCCRDAGLEFELAGFVVTDEVAGVPDRDGCVVGVAAAVDVEGACACVGWGVGHGYSFDGG